MFYLITGWISIVGGIIVVIALLVDGYEEEAPIGFMVVGVGIGGLVSTHMLRLLEKGTYYLRSIDTKMNASRSSADNSR